MEADKDQKQFLVQLTKFLPTSVLQSLVSRENQERNLPIEQSYQAAVLVAFIPDFYVDDYERIGSIEKECQFNEKLLLKANKFLELLSKLSSKFRGDLVQLNGDQIVAMFPIQDFGDYFSQGEGMRRGTVKIKKEGSKDVIRAALQVALALKEDSQSALGSRVMTGIGFGQAGLLHVGGVFNRAGYFPFGEALSSAHRCVRYSSHDHPVIVGPEVQDLCAQYFLSTPLSTREDQLWSVQELQGEVLKQSAASNIWRNSLSEETLTTISGLLKPYIPASFRPYLKLTKDKQGNENRRVSILAVNIRAETYFNVNGPDPFSQLQEIVKAFQWQIYRMEGSFDKIIAHDGGLVMVGIWGLGGLSHNDDAQRACLAAFNYQKEFENLTQKLMLQKIKLHMAITSGFITIGIAGNEGSRKEISSLGDPVERAYLILQVAYENKYDILVDQNTKVEASSGVKFEYYEHFNFSHKKLNQPFFIPVNPLKEWWRLEVLQYLTLDPFITLKIHANPFLPDIKDDYQAQYCKPNVPELILESCFSELLEYLSGPEEKVYVFIIRGSRGSGKTIFMRRLMTYLLKEKRSKQINSQGYFFEMCFTSSNAEVQKRFLGIWIPILRHMIAIWSQRCSMKPANIMDECIQKLDRISDKVFILEDLFSIKDLRKSTKQITLEKTPFDQVNDEITNEQIIKDVVDFCQIFVISAIEFCRNEHDLLFFVFIDNASQMDIGSWKLFHAIFTECSSLVVYANFLSLDNFFVQGSLDQDLNAKELKRNMLQCKVLPQAQEFYDKEVVPKIDEYFNIYEVGPIDENLFRQILEVQLTQYQLEIESEIKAQIEFQEKEMNNSFSYSIHKSHDESDKMQRYLMKKCLVYESILDIEPKLVELVIRKCQGNPLYSLEFLKQMMDVSFSSLTFQNEYIALELNILIPTKIFNMSYQTDFWSIQPISSFKSSCVLVEDRLKGLIGNVQKAKLSWKIQWQEFHNCSEIMILLKVISVLGDKVCLELAEYCNIYEDVDFSIDSLLKELEQRDLLEYLYDLDQNNPVYRFTYNFCSQTLRNLQIFEDSRKITHESVIQFLTDNEFKNHLTEESHDVEENLLLQHILAKERVLEEAQLQIKPKIFLINKRINNCYKQKKLTVKEGTLRKKEKGTSRNFDKVYAVVTFKEFIWYENLNAFKKSLPPLGSILIQEMKVSQYQSPQVAEGHAFKLEIFRNDDKSGKAVFISNSAEKCQEWLAHFEFLLSFNNVKEYSEKHINPNFPIFKKTDTRKRQQQKKKDFSNQITSLGKLLTQSQRIEESQAKKQLRDQSFHRSPQKQMLKHQIQSLYNMISTQFVTHILETSVKPQFTEDRFKNLAETDELFTMSILKDVLEDESEMESREEEGEEEGEEEFRNSQAEQSEEEKENLEDIDEESKSEIQTPRLTIDQEAAQKLFNYSEKPQQFDLNQHETPEVGVVRDFRGIQENAYFFSSLNQPQYWQEDKFFNRNIAKTTQDHAINEGQVAFCVQSQPINSKFQQNIDQSAFYTLGKDEEVKKSDRSNQKQESLASTIRKLRNMVVTQHEKDISPEYVTQVMKILEQAQKNYKPRREYIQTPTGSLSGKTHSKNNHSIYSQDILQSAPVLHPSSLKQLATPAAAKVRKETSRFMTNGSETGSQNQQPEVRSGYIKRQNSNHQESLLQLYSQSVKEKFNSFLGGKIVHQVKKHKFQTQSQDQQPVSKNGDSKLTSIASLRSLEQSKQDERHDPMPQFGHQMTFVPQTGKQNLRQEEEAQEDYQESFYSHSLQKEEEEMKEEEASVAEESCNVGTDMEESVEIVTASKEERLSFMQNPELEQSSGKKSQQILMSNFNNQKRKRPFNHEVQVMKRVTPTKKDQARILKLSQDTQAVILAPTKRNNEAIVVQKGTRVFVERYLEEKNLVQAAFLKEGLKYQVLCSIEEEILQGDSNLVYVSRDSQGQSLTQIHEQSSGSGFKQDLLQQSRESDASPARVSVPLTKMQLRLEKKKLIKKQNADLLVQSPEPKAMSRRRMRKQD